MEEGDNKTAFVRMKNTLCMRQNKKAWIVQYISDVKLTASTRRINDYSYGYKSYKEDSPTILNNEHMFKC
jgi:hypothetical protein